MPGLYFHSLKENNILVGWIGGRVSKCVDTEMEFQYKQLRFLCLKLGLIRNKTDWISEREVI